jgi:uncharacterized protein
MVYSNKTAIITGGSSGIGKTFAHKLAANGLHLCIIARNEGNLIIVKNEILNKYDVPVTVIAADLSTSEGLKKVSKFIDNTPNIAYLINNAGKTFLGPSFLYSIGKEKEMINLHIKSFVNLSHRAARKMEINNFGNIINVASFSGLMKNVKNETLYRSTKAFQIEFSKTLSFCLRNTNVNVQVLCPGYTKTNFHRTEEFKRNKKAVYKEIPNFFWMSSEKVVKKSLEQLPKKKLIVVPGFLNKLFVAFVNSFLYKFLQLIKK